MSLAGSRTPFADAVLRLRGSGRPEADIVSFHALPWAQGNSLRDGGPIADKYAQLFGGELLASEMTYSGNALDSFFHPSGPLDLAQSLAAQAFGGTYTFFVTCGTTLSNHVAVDAIDGYDRRLLVDRTTHHSIHVAVGRVASTVEYAPCTTHPDVPGQPLLDVPGMLRMLRHAHRDGRPYHAVVLAGSSYDGILADVPAIVAACLSASPATTTFLVDEAWSAINTFHSGLRPLTALAAAAKAEAAGQRIQMLVTQSAHKSMSAARQASYLHVAGDQELVDQVRACLNGRHTTSPSIPILASLDLARAHAQAEGERLLQRSIDLAASLRHTIATEPTLAGITATAPYPRTAGYFMADPTKVRIDVTGLGLPSEQARARLFGDHGIYVARTLAEGFLVNIHIGTDHGHVDRLLEALRSLAHRCRLARARPSCGATADGLVVAYPPGIPLAVPGDPWTDEHQSRLEVLRQQGSDIYTLPVPRGATRG